MTSLKRKYSDDGYDDVKPLQKQPPAQTQHKSILRNKVILSILVTETAERVAYFGFRAVLVLYFKNGLKFSESSSVSLFALVGGLAYLSPLVGAILADSVWGRYRTIWRFGTVYSIGMCLITLGAYQSGNLLAQDNFLFARSLSFVGLILVCLGTGGIKPCVSAFGADQVVLGDSQPTRRVSETSSSRKCYSDIGDEVSKELLIEGDKLPTEGAHKTKVETPISSKISTQQENEENVREFFNSFYFCINVGALLSFAIMPMVRAHYGFGAAFLVPTIFMIGALGIFSSQHKLYKHRIRDSSQLSLFTTLRLCMTIFFAKNIGNYHQISDSTAESNYMNAPLSITGYPPSVIQSELSDREMRAKEENMAESEIAKKHFRMRQDAEQVLHLMPLMLFFPVFWMLYDQQSSVWTLQATRLNRHGLEPEQTGILNPLEIMIFIPLSDQIIYPWLENKGFNIKPLRRMEYGMFLTAVAFFASTMLEYSIQHQPLNSVSLAWQIPQITILTVAEILLNVTGLEFAYSQAPESMQAVILAVFLFTTAIGDGFGSILFATVFRELSTSVTLVTCAVCMLVNLALFSRVARQWRPYRNQLESSEEEKGLELNALASTGANS